MSRDAGINLFDTADMYSWGTSEKILGKALGDNLNDVLIATKVGMQVGDDPNDRGLSRKHIIDQCERSLRNLGRDYIDLYQVHSWMARPLSRKHSAPWITSYSRARYVISAARTTPPGSCQGTGCVGA